MLDSRIAENKKPLTGFDIEEAKKFIGQKVYFGDNVINFENLSLSSFYDTLVEIDTKDCNYPFVSSSTAKSKYRFFIPEVWVGKKIVYKPFDIDDWHEKYSLNDKIVFKHKGKVSQVIATVLYLGFIEPMLDEKGNNVEILLGNAYYTFNELLENYELFDFSVNTWVPFGIKED